MIQVLWVMKYLFALACIGSTFFISCSFSADDGMGGLEYKISAGDFKRENSLETCQPNFLFQENSGMHFLGNEETSLSQLSHSSRFQKDGSGFFENVKLEEGTRSIFDAVQPIMRQIHDARKEGDVKKIFQAYKAFKSCDYEGAAWERLGQALEVSKWPSQSTWKEAVGSELFFPKQAMDWEVTPAETYLLERIDTIWAFAIGTKFKHPFSAYYLARVLDRIHSASTDAEKPDLFYELYDQAFKDFDQSLNTPDLCYILGRSYANSGDLMYRFDHKKAIEWYAKGGDLKNRYQLLEIRESYEKIYTPPTLEEYLELARAGYKLAYLQAAKQAQSVDKKLEILHEAVDQGYFPALIDAGMLYEDLYEKRSLAGDQEGAESFLQEARKRYQKAGEQGVAEGYLMLGKTYVGDIIIDDSYSLREKLRLLPAEDIEQGISSFKQAGAAHHPEGWDCLAQLCFDLYQPMDEEAGKDLSGSQGFFSKPDKEKYEKMAYQALVRGIALGSQWAYHKVNCWYSQETLEALMRDYGRAPQEERFCELIEKFLKEDFLLN